MIQRILQDFTSQFEENVPDLVKNLRQNLDFGKIEQG
jgi:hypothetical protein